MGYTLGMHATSAINASQMSLSEARKCATCGHREPVPASPGSSLLTDEAGFLQCGSCFYDEDLSQFGNDPWEFESDEEGEAI